jgi:hypothetical protein
LVFIWDRETKDFGLNNTNHSLNLIYSWFHHECHSDLLVSSPSFWILPHFQTIHYVSFYSGSVLPHGSINVKKNELTEKRHTQYLIGVRLVLRSFIIKFDSESGMEDQDSIFGRNKDSPQRPDRLWDPSSLLSKEYRGLLPRGVKRPDREADHSPPSSAEVKKAWRYNSSSPVCLHGALLNNKYIFMAWYLVKHRTALPLP